jgi:hypothetical protein
MRGRMLMFAAGRAAGQRQAQQQAAQADQYRQEGAQQAMQQQAAPAPAPAPAAAPVATSGQVPTDELQKLADLHNSGVLSDEEFAAAKKKLLGI